MELHPWLRPPDDVKESRVIESGIGSWGQPSKQGRGLGTIQVTSTLASAQRRIGAGSGICYTSIYLLDFFQTPVVIKTEVHDSQKIRFWSSSQNREINASDQQK